MSGDERIKWTLCHVFEKFNEGPRGYPFSPVFPSQPAAYFLVPIIDKAHNVASHLPIIKDRLFNDGFIGQDFFQ